MLKIEVVSNKVYLNTTNIFELVEHVLLGVIIWFLCTDHACGSVKQMIPTQNF